MRSGDLRVSVIITSYNQKHYLIEAIESVLGQTVKPYEIIVADDLSKDGSRETILNYATRYPGLVKPLLQDSNLGIPRNRNAALRMVTGDYVSILDGDDRFLPRKVEAEIEALLTFPDARCVYSDVRFLDGQDRFISLRDGKTEPSGDIFTYVARGKFGILRSLLIDYSLLRDVGFLDERFPKYDGFELTLRLAKESKFIYVAEPLVEVRLHSNGDTGKSTTRDYIHDFEGIYSELNKLVADAPEAERVKLAWLWSDRMWALHLRDAVETGKTVKALALSVKGIARGFDFEAKELDLLPEGLRDSARWLQGLLKI